MGVEVVFFPFQCLALRWSKRRSKPDSTWFYVHSFEVVNR